MSSPGRTGLGKLAEQAIRAVERTVQGPAGSLRVPAAEGKEDGDLIFLADSGDAREFKAATERAGHLGAAGQ